MRKTPKVRAKTLEFELSQFLPNVGLNTIHISDLEVGIKRRACPCTKIEIPLKSYKDLMLVPVPVSLVPVQKLHRFSNSTWVPVPLLFGTSTIAPLYLTACGYQYQLVRYQYQCLHSCPTSLQNCPGPPDSTCDRQRLSEVVLWNQTAMKMCTRHQKT